ASQTLEDGAKSENTTFNDNASGTVSARALMLGDTMLNGTSHLTVMAKPDATFQPGAGADPVDSSIQINHAILNSNSYIQLSPDAGNNAHQVDVGTLTMNGGSVLFGHQGDYYTTLKAQEVNGSGGNLIMNGNLSDHLNDQLHTQKLTGSGTYNIVLNNQDSGKEL
ncbi:pertactin-like passenger domain-containing protein, partial [Enterobacter asburiae]|uniref:pertactin-like passenger domain-containing protein n=1 Tax=Enterobacter asburiae TaxID=61645 RepID=UPI001E2C9A1B